MLSPASTPNIQLSPSVRHIAQPLSPVRPNAHARPHNLAHTQPIRAPSPEKSVTFPRHPFPALLNPTPRTSHLTPRLRHFFPRIRPNPPISPALLNHTHIRATLAQARDRLRGPKTLPPNGMRPQASVGASLVGALSQLRPPGGSQDPTERPCSVPMSYSVTRCDTCAPKTRASITDSSTTADTLSYETNRMTQKLTQFAVPQGPCWLHPSLLPLRARI